MKSIMYFDISLTTQNNYHLAAYSSSWDMILTACGLGIQKHMLRALKQGPMCLECRQAKAIYRSDFVGYDSETALNDYRGLLKSLAHNTLVEVSLNMYVQIEFEHKNLNIIPIRWRR